MREKRGIIFTAPLRSSASFDERERERDRERERERERGRESEIGGGVGPSGPPMRPSLIRPISVAVIFDLIYIADTRG